MARRTTPTEKPQRPALSVEQKRRSIEKLLRRIKELEVFDPQAVQKRWPPEVTAIETSIDEVLSAVFGYGTVEYNRYSRATTLDHGPVVMGSPFGGMRDDTFEARQYLAEGKQESILMLKQAIRVLEEEIADQEHENSSTPLAQPSKRLSRKVFVVHGHDHGARDAVARFLEKIELEAIVLQEQPDQG